MVETNKLGWPRMANGGRLPFAFVSFHLWNWMETPNKCKYPPFSSLITYIMPAISIYTTFFFYFTEFT